MRISILPILLACGASLFAAPTGTKPDVEWAQRYYEKPQPERFETETRLAQKAGFLSRPGGFYPTAAFNARLFSTNPGKIVEWMKIVDTFPDEARRPFLAALRWADTPVTLALLDGYIKAGGPLAEFCKTTRAETPPDFKKNAHPTADELDGCWASFFATGEPAYALTVIRRAVAPKEGEQVDPARFAARWSLRSLCDQQKRIMQIKDEFYAKATDAEKKEIDAIFAAKTRKDLQ